jgi:hypothetical protein
MFGDTLPPLVEFNPLDLGNVRAPGFSTALGGGASYNISENNTSIPTDRVYFIYNAFFNALQTTTGGFQPTTNSVDLHRYLIGFEKTFLDGNASIDFRMPLFSGLDFQDSGFVGNTGNVGNLAMYLKGLLYIDDDVALASGMGIGLPTGSDVRLQSQNDFLTIQNQSVRLMPFVAMTMSPGEKWFVQSFGQVNFAASGNDVIGGSGNYGVFTEQNLLQFDLGLGRWMWRDSQRDLFTGLAGIAELHYTTTIQDSDTVNIPITSVFGGNVTNSANRLDLLNLTSGLHFQLGPMSNLRVGAVVPLRAEPDRVFDSELQVFFNRFF